MTEASVVPIVAAVAAAGAGVLQAAPDAEAPWLLVNESRSLPPGLYVRTSEAPAPGRIVVIAPPPTARAYLTQTRAGPDVRLLKRIAAVGGEVACRNERTLTWPRGHATARARDRTGRRLPAWRDCRRLGPGELLVLGDTATSFDSRYFGPVHTDAVVATYREVWRW